MPRRNLGSTTAPGQFGIAVAAEQATGGPEQGRRRTPDRPDGLDGATGAARVAGGEQVQLTG
jgi:hypothetical protein